MKEMVIICNKDGIRLDLCILKSFDAYSRTYIQKLIADNFVTVNDNFVKPSCKIKTGDIIKLNIPDPKSLDILPQKIDISILYEDEDILVINKPQGMVVHPACGNFSNTLVNALLNYCKDSLSDINGIIRPGIVHRIDKDTSGVIVVAKNNVAHQNLSEKLKNHDIKRVYIAIVQGIINENSGKIDAPIGRSNIDRKKMAVNTKIGRKAVTYFKVIERFKNATLVEVTLETGRTHQIRVHMSFIGHPIIGDKVYGTKKMNFGLNGQALHAKILGFIHPTKNEYMEFEAPLPDHFENVLKVLRNS